MTAERDLPAGRFSTWLRETTAAQTADGTVDVPCGTCTACCRSSYFIHIRPHETATLRRIPKNLLAPAPGLPKGNMLLGYDERGHCPMLVDDQCSIYEDRPLTCRKFDCRVFAAAGLSVDADGKPAIAERVGRWKFDLADEGDVAAFAAVRSAAAFLSARPEAFPDGVAPNTEGQLAMAALRVHELFLGGTEADIEAVREELSS